jgi:hypothetical protein
VTLRLIREPTVNGATLGCLFADGHWAAFTLEDAIREVEGQPVSAWKVPGETAIPAGQYRVIVTPSAHFGRPLPLLVDVPGFEGVRIHPGNVPADTQGCILVGLDRDPGRVLQSRVAFDRLFDQVAHAPGAIWIAIEQPYSVAQAA